MNKSYFIHAGWAVVAVATFILGSKFESEAGSDSRTLANGGSSANTPGLSTRSIEGGADGESTRSGRIGGSRAAGEKSVKTILSDVQIKSLGDEFRTAKGPIARRLVFSKILENLTPENAITMREQILHLDNNSSEFREFHYAWGAMAGETAVLNGADTPERDMASTFAGWAGTNPDAALAYFNNLSPEEQKGNDLKWGAAYGLADNDPNLATQFALDQLENGDRDARRMIDIAARSVLRSGDVEEAARWSAAIPAGEIQNEAVERVAREYADEDPEGAYAWASSLPDGEGKNKAIGRSFQEWAGDDPQAAASKLETMSESPERDAATFGYANRVVWDDPVAGLQWAGTISDEDTRVRAIIDTGRVFFRKDPEAAKEWLTNSGLNEKQQTEVTRRRRRG